MAVDHLYGTGVVTADWTNSNLALGPLIDDGPASSTTAGTVGEWSLLDILGAGPLSATSVTYGVRARYVAGTSGRTQQMTVALYNGGTLVQSFSTGNLGVGYDVYTSTVSVSHARADVADYRIRVTHTEGGGMDGTKTAQLDKLWADVTYTYTAPQSVLDFVPRYLRLGRFVEFWLDVRGGATPHTYSVDSGALPTGLSLNTSTGVISGTPTSVGSYSFALRITGNDSEFTVTSTLTIDVRLPSPIDDFQPLLYYGDGTANRKLPTLGLNLRNDGGFIVLIVRTPTNAVEAPEKYLIICHTADDGTSAWRVLNAAGSLFATDVFTTTSDGRLTVGVTSSANRNGALYELWLFRSGGALCQRLDYTGTGAAGNVVPHTLGVAPAVIIAKRTSDSTDIACYNKGAGESNGYHYPGGNTVASNVFTNVSATSFTPVGSALNNNTSLHWAFLLGDIAGCAGAFSLTSLSTGTALLADSVSGGDVRALLFGGNDSVLNPHSIGVFSLDRMRINTPSLARFDTSADFRTYFRSAFESYFDQLEDGTNNYVEHSTGSLRWQGSSGSSSRYYGIWLADQTTARTLVVTSIASGEAFGSPTVGESDGSQEISGVGNIASAEAFGTVTLTTGAVSVAPSAIASAEVFGTASIAVQLFPTGIASAEAFGTASLTSLVTLAPTAIATAEAFGTAVITTGAVTVQPSAIASAEAFGTAVLTTGAVSVQPSAIASAEAFGTAQLVPGLVTVSPTAIASAEAFGSHVVENAGGEQHVTQAGNIASAEAFGTASLTSLATVQPSAIAAAEVFGTAALTPGLVTVQPSAIASLEAFGIAVLSTGAVQVQPSAIASAEAFGTHVVQPGTVELAPTAIASAEAFGALSVNLHVAVAGIGSAEAFGAATFTVGAVTVQPPAIASTEAFGTPVVSTDAVYLSPDGIATAEAFGTAVFTTGAVTIAPSAIASAEAFGTPSLLEQQALEPVAIASAEAFGTAILSPGAVTVQPAAIASAEAFGTATVQPGAVEVLPSAIASAEAFGTAVVRPVLRPDAIASAEAFGTAVLSPGAVTLLVQSIATGEVFGLPDVIAGLVELAPTGIPGEDIVGEPMIVVGGVTVQPSAIPSAEAFGSVLVFGDANVVLSPPSIVPTEALGFPKILRKHARGVRARPHTLPVTAAAADTAVIHVQAPSDPPETSWLA